MRATLKDVAQRAGVSSATVSYVLNGKQSVSEKTKQRVLEAVRQLDYVPDLNARGLSMRDSKLIGVVVPQTEPGEHLMFQNTFYSEVLGSIEYYARQNGYHILISATDANESYQQMKESQIPIVLIDSYCNDYYYHNIRIDNAYGSYLATRYILQNGHREIAFLVGRLQENGVMKKRLTGYQKALAEFGVPYQPDYVLEGQINYESGVQHARAIVERHLPVTAAVAAADILAIGAMKGFYELGLRIPDDLSIIGFDDLEISRYMTPGLTTIKQQISLKGQRGGGTAAEKHRTARFDQTGGDPDIRAGRAGIRTQDQRKGGMSAPGKNRPVCHPTKNNIQACCRKAHRPFPPSLYAQRADKSMFSKEETQMKKARVLPLAAGMLSVAMVLTACGSPAASASSASSGTAESAASASEASQDEPVTITYCNFNASGGDEETLQKMYEAFHEEYPNITVEIETIGFDDYFTQMQTRVAGGTAPDCYELNIENFSAYANKGVLAEITGVDLSRIDETALNAFNVGGKQYGLPGNFSNVVLVYNKDLFDQAGLDYPTNDWTQDDVQAAAEAIRALGDDIYGIYQPVTYNEFYKVAAQYGGSLLSEDGTQFTINSPENVEAAQMMVDRVLVSNVQPTEVQMGGMGDWDLFMSGRLGMIPTGIWAFSSFADGCDFDWDIVVEPGAKQKATAFFSNACVINADSEHKDAAATWITWLCSSDAAA